MNGEDTNEVKVGTVFQYFAKPMVAAIKITDGSISVGDTLHFKGATTDFTQTIDSIEIDRQQIETANAGQDVGIKVKDRVRPNDDVYKI